MKKLLNLFDRWIAFASQTGGAIACSFIFITAVIITINSFSRYIFNHPFLFVDEYARYMLVALFYLGLGFTLRARKHVSADLIVRRFKGRTQIILKVITSSFGSIVIFLMLWNSWKSFSSVFKSKMVSLTPLETPLWIPNLFVAIGLSLFLLDMLAHIGQGIKEIVREKSQSE